MNPYTAIIAAAGAIVALGGCSSSRKAPSAPQAAAAVSRHTGEVIAGKPASFVPRAVIYKTSGDFIDNVPVQLAADGSVASYPSPADVSPERSTPLRLADGFLLDRRGISASSVFTSYTYARYARLEKAPEAGELAAAIIPGARVTQMYTIDMSPSEAAADTAAVNTIILRDPAAMTPVKTAPVVMEYKEYKKKD